MYKKHQIPLNIFIIFEKVNPIIFTANTMTNNSYICVIPNNWFVPINQLLKSELNLSSSTLIENSAIDTLKYTSVFKELSLILNNNRLIVYYIYYIYFTKTRLTFLLNFNNTNTSLTSIDKYFKNSNWLERETGEMFGIHFLLKEDQRILLLDYSRNEYPLLKDFPCEGYSDIYYNFFENQLTYINHEFIEL